VFVTDIDLSSSVLRTRPMEDQFVNTKSYKSRDGSSAKELRLLDPTSGVDLSKHSREMFRRKRRR